MSGAAPKRKEVIPAQLTGVWENRTTVFFSPFLLTSFSSCDSEIQQRTPPDTHAHRVDCSIQLYLNIARLQQKFYTVSALRIRPRLKTLIVEDPIRTSFPQLSGIALEKLSPIHTLSSLSPRSLGVVNLPTGQDRKVDPSETPCLNFRVPWQITLT